MCVKEAVQDNDAGTRFIIIVKHEKGTFPE